MNSPYFTGNVGAGWGPPPGLAQFQAQRSEALRHAAQSIGSAAGAIGGGMVGAFQGAANPQVVGKETAAGGAFKGFMQNYSSAMNGGGNGGGMASMFSGGGDASSGIGALMGGGKGTPNFKQLQEGGKAADSFRNMVKAGQLTAPGVEPNVFGTDDEWKTLSSMEKFSRVGQMFQAQQMAAAKQAYQKGALDVAMAQQRMTEAAQEGQARSAFRDTIRIGTPQTTGGFTAGGVTIPGQPSFAMQPTPLTGAQQVHAALASGMPARDVSEIAQANYYLQRAAGDGSAAFFKPGDTNFALPGVKGMLRVPTGPNTSVLVADQASAGRAVPITGPNGEALGYGLPSRSGVQPLRSGEVTNRDQFNAAMQREKVARHALADPLNSQLPERKAYWEGELQSALDEQKQFSSGGRSADGAKPAAAALPMPKTKAELKKGQRYQTARGEATWDGEQFVQ